MVQKTPFSKSLADHEISANLIDVDLYRIHGGMAVETDYIIRVERKDGKDHDTDSAFESFILSKTFHHFRTFAKQLKSIADNAMAPRQRKGYTADENTKKLGRYCAAVHHLIQSQSHQYIGKVSYAKFAIDLCLIASICDCKCSFICRSNVSICLGQL